MSEAHPEPIQRLWTGEMEAPQSFRLGEAELSLFTAANPASDRDNQDAVALVATEAGQLVLAVADGAGGQPAGDRASAAALSAFVDTVHDTASGGFPLRESVLQGFDRANEAVLALGVGAATTLVVVELAGATMRTYHAGDSRALVCGRKGLIKLLTPAHSPVGHAVQAGFLEEEEALLHEDLHLVSNMVGGDDMRVEVGAPVELASHDTLLLASDGVFDNLGPEEIVHCVRKGSIDEATETLVAAVAHRMTGEDDEAPCKPDDVSLICLRRAR